MAEVRIKDLAAGALADTDKVVIDRVAGTASATVADLRAALLAASSVWRDIAGVVYSIAANVAIAADAAVLLVDTTGSRTLTLPSPLALAGKLPLLIVDVTNNAFNKWITLARSGGEQIDGVAADKVLRRNAGRWWVWTNGTHWFTAECAPDARSFESTNPPTVNADETLGYARGSLWFDTLADAVYVCADPTTGAAVWRLLGISDHGELTGLADDDHPQYLLADGSRSLSGHMDVDAFMTIDGRDVSADGATLDAHVGAGGAAHAEATTSAAGFMSADDKDLIFDRARAAILDSDFWSGITATVFVSDSSGAGSAGGTGVSSAQNHPGVVRQATGTTTTGRGAIRSSQALVTGGGAVDVEWVVQVEALSTVAEEFDVLVGLANAVTSLTPVGVYFTYQRLGVGVNWLANANGGAATQVDTGVAVTTGWVRLGIRVNTGATSVEFYIDGVLVATIATNVPTSSSLALACAITKTAGTTSRNLNADYAAYRKRFSTSR